MNEQRNAVFFNGNMILCKPGRPIMLFGNNLEISGATVVYDAQGVRWSKLRQAWLALKFIFLQV